MSQVIENTIENLPAGEHRIEWRSKGKNPVAVPVKAAKAKYLAENVFKDGENKPAMTISIKELIAEKKASKPRKVAQKSTKEPSGQAAAIAEFYKNGGFENITAGLDAAMAEFGVTRGKARYYWRRTMR